MVTIYHNPRCTKSKATLKLLQSKDIEPEVIEYLENPPSVDELTDILLMLDVSARDIMRKNEAIYKELELGDESLDDTALLNAIVHHPNLMERPIVVNGEKAAIGRPPEKVLDIL
ncbi:MAG: arsenate reductase (glutaredoxin) [Methyloligellaceae bacterium]